jgi:fido (protein-threonine AMPylation protein)
MGIMIKTEITRQTPSQTLQMHPSLAQSMASHRWILAFLANHHNEELLQDYCYHVHKKQYLKDAIVERNASFEQFVLHDEELTEEQLMLHRLLDNISRQYTAIFGVSTNTKPREISSILNIDNIRNIHDAIGQGVFESHGLFRSKWIVSDEGTAFLAPTLIHQTFVKIIDTVVSNLRSSRNATMTVEAASAFASQYYNIMPFEFGNETMLRILISFCLETVTVVPLIMSEDSGWSFRNCLRETRINMPLRFGKGSCA